MSHYEKDGTLTLDSPVELPDVLDILIVGGGPAGTATAFRAKELGLAALVIDFDDILKRIRDYPKDKLILPDFGGGDKMKFPEGDDLIRSLRFEPIDKDDICDEWKRLYRKFNVPAKIGLEITGMERDGDVWEIVTWNHQIQVQEVYKARHVVLALGRGVPRRFDIPGDTDGIAYRLDDPERYVEGPVCVVGGGTSAAEAVIAISNAKADAEDVCPVYWSYRGSKMPRVSKALSDVFFEAYVGNGNIRYHPNSEPVAVVTGPDRTEYLSLRIDRKELGGRPHETVHLEFPKMGCVACIGEDLPTKLLAEFGIEVVDVGKPDKKKEMMLLTPLLETQQENVYLIGDLLSQTYLETDSFDAPAESYKKVKHRGNIKTALRDGVLVAGIIEQRLEGVPDDEIEVVVEPEADEDEEEAAAEPTGDDKVAGVLGLKSEERDAEGEPTRQETEEPAFLVRTTQADVEAEEYDLSRDHATTIGRQDCHINFPNDTLLSEDHASITYKNGTFFLRDDGSKSGTYLKVRPERSVEVGEGTLLRPGRQIVVIGRDDGAFHLQQYDQSGRKRQRFPLPEDTTTVFGRSGGKRDPDVILDEEDRTLSRFHFSVTPTGDTVQVEDFNSVNGTYVKIDGEMALQHGDVFRVGGQMFEVKLRESASEKTGTQPAVDVAPEEPEEELAPEEAPAEPAAAPHITFAGQDIDGEIESDSTILEWADENEVELDYECWVGMCGCDAIRIVEGAEHLNDVDDKEKKTLDRRGLEPGEYRLACMTKCSGPVKVEVVD